MTNKIAKIVKVGIIRCQQTEDKCPVIQLLSLFKGLPLLTIILKPD
jgi:hypothetical protein